MFLATTHEKDMSHTWHDLLCSQSHFEGIYSSNQSCGLPIDSKTSRKSAPATSRRRHVCQYRFDRCPSLCPKPKSRSSTYVHHPSTLERGTQFRRLSIVVLVYISRRLDRERQQVTGTHHAIFFTQALRNHQPTG